MRREWTLPLPVKRTGALASRSGTGSGTGPVKRLVALLALLAAPVVGQTVPDPCTGRGTILLVLTGPHELRECEAGRTSTTWRVALGLGGTDKTTTGDNKTPLGIYELGTPHPSRLFGLFIPIGYPTPDQQRRGYTGSDIGIHGPQRAFRDLGLANVARDWTWGCIAVSSDEIITDISTWIRRHHVRTIELI